MGYGLIRDYCKAHNITRRDMGLVTGARSSMYFGGEWKSVSYDNIVELAKVGTDILFIEKADIAEVLSPFAGKYGVAVVNTIGYLTEYGRFNDSSKTIRCSGTLKCIYCNICINGLLQCMTH